MTTIEILALILAGITLGTGAIYWFLRRRRIEAGGNDIGLYDWLSPKARQVKIALQMVVGAGLASLIFIKLFCRDSSCDDIGFITTIKTTYHLSSLRTLEIVGLALAYSSAIELSYTLFTPGPDEAIDPLITGLSAAILLVIAHISSINDINFTNTGSVVFLAIVLAILFIIRRIFIKPHDELEFWQYLIGKWIMQYEIRQTNTPIQSEIELTFSRNGSFMVRSVNPSSPDDTKSNYEVNGYYIPTEENYMIIKAKIEEPVVNDHAIYKVHRFGNSLSLKPIGYGLVGDKNTKIFEKVRSKEAP